jgi:hypothetical protein
MLRRAHNFLRRREAPQRRDAQEAEEEEGREDEETEHDPTLGYLYLVLPLSCTSNSRYLTPSRLQSILTTLGWKVVRRHDSAKLTYWLLQPDGDGRGDGRKWKKEEVRPGASR